MNPISPNYFVVLPKQSEQGASMKRIDLIIDALYKTKLLMDAHGQYPHTLSEVNEALAAARELRALKPVLWKATGDAWFYKKPLFEATPLYALDEVKHD